MNLKNETRWLVLLTVVTFAMFANTLDGGFVYDDNRQIVLNPLIQDKSLYGTALTSDVWAFKGDGTRAASNYWRPTFTAWCIFNFAMFGLSPFGWHLLNVLMHAAVVLLAYLLLRQWGLTSAASFVVAALFSIHPVHSESVAWISGSPDMLLALFILASLLMAGRWINGRKTRDLIASIALYCLALGAKETAAFAMPVYACVFFFRRNGEGKADISTRQTVARTAIFAGFALIFFVARYYVLGAVVHPVEDATGIAAAIKSVPLVAAFYLRQVTLPYEIGENYWLRPVETIGLLNFVFPLIIVLGTAALGWKIARRSHYGALGATLFAAMLLPAINISMFPVEMIVHDRYLYLPLLGFFVAGAAGLSALGETFGPKARAVVPVFLIAVGSFYAYQTFNANRHWHNGLSLWEHNVLLDPASGASWTNYGAELSLAGLHTQALDAYNRGYANRPSVSALMSIGRENISLGNLDEGIQKLTDAINTPNEQANAYTLFQSYEALAIAYQQSGELEKAEKALREAIARLPIYRASLTEKLAVVLYLQGRKDAALSELESTKTQARRELLPNSKLVFFRLGMLYMERGRRVEARSAFQEFLNTSEKGGSLFIAERRQVAELMRGL